MSEIVKVIEVLAQSEKGWEEAAQQAVQTAAQSLRNVQSIYIKEFSASVQDGKVTQYRITAKISFDLESS